MVQLCDLKSPWPTSKSPDRIFGISSQPWNSPSLNTARFLDSSNSSLSLSPFPLTPLPSDRVRERVGRGEEEVNKIKLPAKECFVPPSPCENGVWTDAPLTLTFECDLHAKVSVQVSRGAMWGRQGDLHGSGRPDAGEWVRAHPHVRWPETLFKVSAVWVTGSVQGKGNGRLRWGKDIYMHE
ncbi:hypothetical protein CEXT_179081 [Caerostris extrusa]|uniref:Galectin n=1 Tax=Caerostris extrusa TaxID=172846 RepID=A0AAV4S0H0_CAEEX|nr:hypothetical protein CEXT_179081 [Caerostris extrusa]